MSGVARWNDDRLDEMNGRLGRVEPVVVEVAVIKTELRGLRGALEQNTRATKEVAGQMEKAQLEPLTRARNFRSQIAIAVVGAMAGGGLALIGALIGHG